MELRIGNVQLSAGEHPWRGVVLLTCITPRTMAQFDIAVPTACSAEQIAELIYTNIVLNFREEAEICKRHFEARGMLLFQ